MKLKRRRRLCPPRLPQQIPTDSVAQNDAASLPQGPGGQTFAVGPAGLRSRPAGQSGAGGPSVRLRGRLCGAESFWRRALTSVRSRVSCPAPASVLKDLRVTVVLFCFGTVSLC